MAGIEARLRALERRRPQAVAAMLYEWDGRRIVVSMWGASMTEGEFWATYPAGSIPGAIIGVPPPGWQHRAQGAIPGVIAGIDPEAL